MQSPKSILKGRNVDCITLPLTSLPFTSKNSISKNGLIEFSTFARFPVPNFTCMGSPATRPIGRSDSKLYANLYPSVRTYGILCVIMQEKLRNLSLSPRSLPDLVRLTILLMTVFCRLTIASSTAWGGLLPSRAYGGSRCDFTKTPGTLSSQELG